jgi:acyl-CoA thioester hydrolase
MKRERKSLTFTFPARIYYKDTDAGGVVYHANYLELFERCRTEWLRANGFWQAQLLRDQGIVFVVRSVAIDYLKPARLDDLVTLGLEVEKITRSQIFFRQEVLRGDPRDGSGPEEVLASGRVQIVCVSIRTDSGQMKITSIPAAMRAQLEAPQ